MSLSALSPLDGRYASKVAALNPYFSEQALIRHRVLIEVRWLQALAGCKQFSALPKLDKAAQQALNAIVEDFDTADAEAVKTFERTTNHDVKAVEYFIKDKLAAIDGLAAYQEMVHFGCTSEDINNLAHATAWLAAREQVMAPAYQQLIDSLRTLAHTQAAVPMLARTHGQAASPTTVGKVFADMTYRLTQTRDAVMAVTLTGKCNGAVGNYHAMHIAYPKVDWPAVTADFIASLGLTQHPYTAQIEPHDQLAALSDAMARANAVMIDVCRDIWGYIALGYFGQQHKAGEVGSSTMPHKINPIDFENAEGNLGLGNSLLRHFSEKLPISRWQRDLSDSTVLRNVGSAWGYTLMALHSLQKGLSKLTVNQDNLAKDLDQHWEVLAEAIQTILRREGIAQAYEQLKTLTRGQTVTQEALQAFIAALDVSADVKKELLALTPATYTGLAAQLAKAV